MRVRWLLAVILSITSTVALADSLAAINTKGVFNSAAIKGYDPVSYWNSVTPKKGNKQWRFKWRGADWHFASQENKALFVDNPKKYAPQYGGYCAWAMADGEGRAVAVDPTVWTIYNHKLYLNYNVNVKEQWLKTKMQDIARADHNYPAITNVAQYKEAKRETHEITPIYKQKDR